MTNAKREKEGVVYIEPPSMDELNKRREELLETWRECREITKIAKRIYRRFHLFLESEKGVRVSKISQEIQDKNPELEKKFKDFIENLPKQITLQKAGPKGEDIILPLKTINGVPVYIAEVELPF